MNRIAVALLAVAFATPVSAAQFFGSSGRGVRATPAAPVGGAIPTLVPSTGWAGATSTPAAQGSSGDLGYSRAAIAGWDSVPFQTIVANGTLQVCADAFHIRGSDAGAAFPTGIDHVTFAVEGGPWATATKTFTTQANQYEFCANINAADFATDKVIEIRAIAYPVTGVPLVLQGGNPNSDDSALLVKTYTSMYAYVAQHGTVTAATAYVASTGNDGNDCSSATPCRSIGQAAAAIQTAQGGDVGGGTVCIKDNADYTIDLVGFYARPSVAQWMTVKPCGGTATKSGARVVAVSGNQSFPSIYKLHLQNLTIYYNEIVTSSPYIEAYYLWFDNVAMDGVIISGTGLTESPNRVATAYYTDSTITNYENGPFSAMLVRGSNIQMMASDATQNAQMVVNTFADFLGYPLAYTLTATARSGNVLTIPTGMSGHQLVGNFAEASYIVGHCDGPPGTSAEPNQITAVDLVLNTMTLTTAPTGFGSLTVKTCEHPDFWQSQGQSGVEVNKIFYGNTSGANNYGQGVFPASFAMTGVAIVNNNIQGGSAYQIGGTDTNFLNQGNTWTALRGLFGVNVRPPAPTSDGGPYADVIFRDETCSPTQSFSVSGVTIIRGTC